MLEREWRGALKGGRDMTGKACMTCGGSVCVTSGGARARCVVGGWLGVEESVEGVRPSEHISRQYIDYIINVNVRGDVWR